jgi:class 3 adenylate cyclase
MTNPIFAPARQKSLLLVDDSVENLQMLSALLQGDYTVKVAKSGEKALEILNSGQEVDLVLMDVLMPGMNGFEACRQIRSQPAHAGIPVLFLTALSEANDETEGFTAGGSDFISKPFHPEVVKARIRLHLALREEKQRSDALLHILLPNKVVNELMQHGSYTPVRHPEACILFFDMVGFTSLSAALSPEVLVDALGDIFTDFDSICARHGVTRIKTIGDAYMVCSGLESEGGTEAAERMAAAAFDFMAALEKWSQKHQIPWQCRIGIHTGAVMSGIVGKTRFQFDVMGDHVNIASRVESAGLPGEVVVSAEFAALLSPSDFALTSLGVRQLKGKGEKELFAVKQISRA